MQTDNFRAGQAPFFVEGTNIKGDETKTVLHRGRLADDRRSLRSASQDSNPQPEHQPGKFIEARGATLYAGNVPVFYFPYYRRRLDQPPNHWSITPGYRSRYGMFFEGTYNWHLSDRLNGAARLTTARFAAWPVGWT